MLFCTDNPAQIPEKSPRGGWKTLRISPLSVEDIPKSALLSDLFTVRVMGKTVAAPTASAKRVNSITMRFLSYFEPAPLDT